MRRKYIPVEKVLAVAGLSESDVVMDVGGGDGFYSRTFSGKCRKVYYVDAADPAVSIMKDNLMESHSNVEILHGDICTMELPHDLTKVFFSNSFHDLGCREKLIDRLGEASTGPLAFVLVEFKKDASIGPPESVKIGADELDGIFGRHGYKLAEREFLEQHYLSTYTRQQQ